MFYVKQIFMMLIGLALIALNIVICIKIEPSFTTFALGFIGTWIVLDAYHDIRRGF